MKNQHQETLGLSLEIHPTPEWSLDCRNRCLHPWWGWTKDQSLIYAGKNRRSTCLWSNTKAFQLSIMFTQQWLNPIIWMCVSCHFPKNLPPTTRSLIITNFSLALKHCDITEIQTYKYYQSSHHCNILISNHSFIIYHCQCRYQNLHQCLDK